MGVSDAPMMPPIIGALGSVTGASDTPCIFWQFGEKT